MDRPKLDIPKDDNFTRELPDYTVEFLQELRPSSIKMLRWLIVIGEAIKLGGAMLVVISAVGGFILAYLGYSGPKSGK
jgi:hypothetical protein